MSALLLGIDIGTSSSKGVPARPDGTVVAVATRPHELALPCPARRSTMRKPSGGPTSWPCAPNSCRRRPTRLPRCASAASGRACCPPTATGYGIRHIFEAMRDAGGGGRRLVVVGGGTKGGLWTQIISDVTNRPQILPRQTIGASYGDALLAAVGVGLAAPTGAWNPPAAVVEPDPATRGM